MIRKLCLVAGTVSLAIGLAGSGEAQTRRPVSVDVNCSAGQTIGDALDKTADEHEIVLRIWGTCRESVEIRRDDVTLEGQTGTGAAILADASQGSALYVNGGRRVRASGLTLQGGNWAALLVVYGDFSGSQLKIGDASTGVSLKNGSNVFLSNSEIKGSYYSGVFASDSTISLQFCSIYKNRSYGIWAQHSRASLFDVEVFSNMTGVAGDGLSLISTAGYSSLRVHDNQLGVRLRLNSVHWHGGAAPTVSNNTTDFDIDASSIW